MLWPPLVDLPSGPVVGPRYRAGGIAATKRPISRAAAIRSLQPVVTAGREIASRERERARLTMSCPAPMLRGVPSDQWDPACWDWPIPDLSDLDNNDPFDETGEVMQVLRQWHAGRCAMDGNFHDVLVTDHDKKTALVRGLLCRSCNGLEASHSDHQPLGRYRQRCPTNILGLTIRYWDPFNGFVEPEEERDVEEFMRRAREIVSRIHIEDPVDPQKS